jgi:flavin-dependent dehydrogenase
VGADVCIIGAGIAGMTAACRSAREGKSGVTFSNFHKRESCQLLVQENTQERIIDLKSAVVLDESELSEFVHEKN